MEWAEGIPQAHDWKQLDSKEILELIKKPTTPVFLMSSVVAEQLQFIREFLLPPAQPLAHVTSLTIMLCGIGATSDDFRRREIYGAGMYGNIST